MLRDATSLAGDNVGVADVVEQRCLTVVYVSHHGHNRRTRQQIFLGVGLLVDCLRHFRTDIFCLETEFFCYKVDGLSIESLVDGNHHADIHTCGDNLVDRHIHHQCQVVGCHEFCYAQRLAFLCLQCGFLALALFKSLTLLFSPFSTLLLRLVGEARKCFLNLLLHVFFADLCLYVALGLVVRTVGVLVLVAAAVVVASTLLLSAGLLSARMLNIDFLLADAFALALLAVGVCASVGLFFLGDALFTLFLLRFLLRTGRLVDGVKVDFAENLRSGDCCHDSLDFVGFRNLRCCGFRRALWLWRRLRSWLCLLFHLRLLNLFLYLFLYLWFRFRLRRRLRCGCGRRCWLGLWLLLFNDRVVVLVEFDFAENLRLLHGFHNSLYLLRLFRLLRCLVFHFVLLTLRGIALRLRLQVFVVFKRAHQHFVLLVGDAKVQVAGIADLLIVFLQKFHQRRNPHIQIVCYFAYLYWHIAC